MTLIGTAWVTPTATWDSPLRGGLPGQVQLWYLRVIQPDGREDFVMAEVRALMAYTRLPEPGAAAGR